MKPIHKMTTRERYRFYRQWHSPFYAFSNSLPTPATYYVAAIIGAVAGCMWR